MGYRGIIMDNHVFFLMWDNNNKPSMTGNGLYHLSIVVMTGGWFIIVLPTWLIMEYHLGKTTNDRRLFGAGLCLPSDHHGRPAHLASLPLEECGEDHLPET